VISRMVNLVDGAADALAPGEVAEVAPAPDEGAASSENVSAEDAVFVEEAAQAEEQVAESAPKARRSR
jgi:hypothetical protein